MKEGEKSKAYTEAYWKAYIGVIKEKQKISNASEEEGKLERTRKRVGRTTGALFLTGGLFIAGAGAYDTEQIVFGDHQSQRKTVAEEVKSIGEITGDALITSSGVIMAGIGGLMITGVGMNYRGGRNRER
jgi:hypothetical protein